MILTMPPALPLAAGPTCTHTRTPSTLLSFPRNTREQTHASPSITIRVKLAEEFQRKTVSSDLRKQAFVCFFLPAFNLFLFCFVLPTGGGSPGCRGVPRTAFQTDQLPQILPPQRAPGRSVA